MVELTERELEILHSLIANEMDGICRDLGYLELSYLINKVRDAQQINPTGKNLKKSN